MATDTTVAATDTATGVGGRQIGLDAFRGLAILLMVLDHVTMLAQGPDLIRDTLGRAAMPMFFILGGHLTRRVGWRHAAILALGLWLPTLIPWLDDPNVLAWYALGAGLIALLRRAGIPVWALLVVGLTLGANHWLNTDPGSFNPWMLFGLMALGAMIPRASFAWTNRLPTWLAVIGRAPLRWYVGHAAVLQLLVVIGGH